MNYKKLAGAAVFTALSYAVSFTAAEIIASKGSCKGEPDFLLILGCRVKGDKPEQTLTTRIDAAADYLKEHKNTVAVCCGGIVHSDQTVSEAQAICEGLMDRGVEAERIILEDESKTTAQNFSNAKKLIADRNPTAEPKIAFLSSEYHLLRAGLIGRIAGVKAESVPAPSPKELRFKNCFREFNVFPETIIEAAFKH